MLGIPLLAAADSQAGSTLLKFITGGGLIGYIIILLSIVALVLVVVHALQIRRTQLVPIEQTSSLRELLTLGRAEEALQYCIMPANDSYLTRILAPGLTRFLKSPFGAFEIKTAIEDAGAEQTERLYRSTDALGVIGSIAPLMGLLGTVWGMIGAFDTVSAGAVSDSAYYEQLASNISLALVTTMQGLVVAIPCVILYSFFRNRIDAIAADAGGELDQLAMLLESAQSTGGARRSTSTRAPSPQPADGGGPR
ncbi:MAG: MotA/TolQ/ExbB proton channel family protein [Phycisphaerales bacterium]|nr:MotA/TolQ/ExbB proton channel family protein [Phycisphaerales bacterium]